MKIELHASNDMTIEAGDSTTRYDVNESDGKLDIKSSNGKDIEI